MFRLIQLYASEDNALVDVDPDGYATELAAWAEFYATPVTFFGIGRFDSDGRLVDITVDPVCTAAGASGLCRNATTVVDTERYHPLCTDCGAWHDAISLRELAKRLGVPVQAARRAAPVTPATTDPVRALSHRIARELATRIGDAQWRQVVAGELARSPRAVNGLFIGVGALSNRQVLDLFPALQHLASLLPIGIHTDLCRAAGKPRSPAGMAALRLGLPSAPRTARPDQI
jgi:hypothetical protein